MKKSDIVSSHHTGFLGVKYKVGVLRAKTGLYEEVNKGHNLILDAGLDLVATNVIAALTKYCHVGTGTDPFQRDSGSTTISRAGSTLTASSGYFEAADVGRLFKFDTGEEVYITSFASTTSVDTVDSGTIASSEGTIWYVDRTTLQTETTRTTVYRTDSGDNSRTLAAGVLTYKRTHQFPPVGGGVTYNEIGWGPANSTALYNGSLITGSVVMLTGDILIVESNLELVQSPITPIAQSDVGAGGFNSSGTIQQESIGLVNLASTGNASSTDGGNAMEPSLNGHSAWRKVAVSELATAHPTYGSDFTLAAIGSQQFVNSTYSAGDFFIDKTGVIGIGDGNSSNINSVMIWDGSTRSDLRVLLTSAQTKINTQTLTIGFRLSWGRVLTN